MTPDTIAATGRKLALLVEQAQDEDIPADRLVQMLEGAAAGIRWEQNREERERRQRQRYERQPAPEGAR